MKKHPILICLLFLFVYFSSCAKKEKPNGGLANLGNTCFANASHQLLLPLMAHGPDNAIRTLFTEKMHRPINDDSRQLQLAYEDLFRALLNISIAKENEVMELDDPYFEEKSSPIFNTLTTMLHHRGEELDHGRVLMRDQMDPSEYLLKVFDYLESASLPLRSPLSHTILNKSTNEEGPGPEPYSFITNIQIPEGAQLPSEVSVGLSLDDLFKEQYISQEDLPQHHITRSIRDLPPFWLFQLARSQHRNGGQSIKLRLPFSIRPFMDLTSSAQGSGRYELQSVVIHLGRSANYGHYVAYRKNFNGDGWKLFDDTRVSAVTEAEVLHKASRDGLLFLYVLMTKTH